MKNIYFFVLFLAHLALNAQNITIPDAHFKAKLLSASPTNEVAQNLSGAWTTIDTNNDGEIQVSEAANISDISIYNPGISTYYIQSIEGVKSFPNLKYLTVSDCPLLTSVDVSGMPKLALVNFDNNVTMSSANFTGCPILENISVRNANIVHLDISNLPKMNNLNCSSGKIQTINYSGSSTIKYLSCDYNEMTSIDVSSLPDLYRFSIIGNSLTSLNVSNRTQLERLSCSANQLTSINLQNTPKLEYIEASYNNLSGLDLSQSPKLNYLRIINNQITNINFSAVPLLKTLMISDNLLTSVDISNNPLLVYPNFQNNNLETLFLKNNKVQSLNYANNPNIHYICCDDAEMSQIISSNTGYGYNNVTVNSYCSFTPGGTFYTVQGTTKYDSNANGCDVNDISKAFQKFTIIGSGTTGSIIADASGSYSIPVQAGSHIITPILENPTYFNISPTGFTANFPAQASPMNQNFCLIANGTHNDLEIITIPVTQAAPGFNSKYKIIYKNKGTTTQSGTIVLNFDDNVMSYLNATTTPSSQTTGALNWSFTSLLPFETREITVTFTLNTPTQVPPLQGGDILQYMTQINGAADETPADNTFVLNQTLVNSFDPNDKTCLEGTTISQTQIGDYVHYLIRFENTGSANAQNIVVKDVIDAAKFDVATLRPLDASHNFVTRVTNNNVVEFIFENIQLPFDDAHNDGYISFKIKTKSILTPGDSFSNTANIYFDYNAPIITNTYTTTVRGVLATSETKTNKDQLSVYPNPVQEVLYIKSKDAVTRAEIYDATGRIIKTSAVKDNALSVSELAKGNYIIKLFTKDQATAQKFIKN
ncbi:T9SS type A sorting domain-containing protein [Chryseobacterium soli]|uniref:DUF7619 domain-containing protein n=1 Tax=Chryseobacterium soli TaxID=445961 RepID=UPI0029538B0E|nr:T9SS type A sorting domain-containing protein [Chryseobacterium soli]MDV7697836.1 T9SS type A sorting domain-containing protein [Chryseobacterium soli]